MTTPWAAAQPRIPLLASLVFSPGCHNLMDVSALRRKYYVNTPPGTIPRHSTLLSRSSELRWLDAHLLLFLNGESFDVSF
ncbi:hypothetical protein BDN67DRAFT_962355 [Paxillus ammoniavirescens]|nr:hypothetical protein BDN67DRAFT_962355 [Paxillus ammoniavirescens]